MDFTNRDFPTDHLDTLRQRLSGWALRLRAVGLDGFVSALLDAAEPLGPLGAQMLWVAQPTLKLFMPTREIDGLAELLDDPEGMIWLRQILTEPDIPIDAEKESS